MKNIPTAEKFLSDNIDRTYFPHIDESIEDKKGEVLTILDCMNEFAKLHVKAALKAAAEKARLDEWPSFDEDEPLYYTIDKESIMDAYPLCNIK